MKLTGYIKFQKKVFVGKQECYGSTYGWRNTFGIRISEDASETFSLYAETILHELLHLWVFILAASIGIPLTEKKQHKFIELIVPKVIRGLRKTYKKELN